MQFADQNAFWEKVNDQVHDIIFQTFYQKIVPNLSSNLFTCYKTLKKCVVISNCHLYVQRCLVQGCQNVPNDIFINVKRC